MSNKRALWTYEEIQEQIKKCDNIIKKTENWKTKNDFIKHKKRLLAELDVYRKLRGIKKNV